MNRPSLAELDRAAMQLATFAGLPNLHSDDRAWVVEFAAEDLAGGWPYEFDRKTDGLDRVWSPLPEPGDDPVDLLARCRDALIDAMGDRDAELAGLADASSADGNDEMAADFRDQMYDPEADSEDSEEVGTGSADRGECWDPGGGPATSLGTVELERVGSIVMEAKSIEAVLESDNVDPAAALAEVRRLIAEVERAAVATAGAPVSDRAVWQATCEMVGLHALAIGRRLF